MVIRPSNNRFFLRRAAGEWVSEVSCLVCSSSIACCEAEAVSRRSAFDFSEGVASCSSGTLTLSFGWSLVTNLGTSAFDCSDLASFAHNRRSVFVLSSNSFSSALGVVEELVSDDIDVCDLCSAPRSDTEDGFVEFLSDSVEIDVGEVVWDSSMLASSGP